MAKLVDQKIIFKKQDSVGAHDALDDKDFLLNCFVDLGDVRLMEDFHDPRCLIVGRTGAGKTALLTKLQDNQDDRVIVVNAESLAMNYISNSTIVKGLMELDIDLNTFFKYLWRHVICVEIFTRHIKITSETDHTNFVERVGLEFRRRNPRHMKALEYLEQWRDSFWKTSDSHVAEMTNRIEDRITGELGIDARFLTSRMKADSAMSSEEKIKIKQKGQSIVNDMQMKEVTGLLDMLDDFIEFHQARYYVVIDKLDEKWVGNGIRYRLIKSLIETVQDLNRLKNIKPIATLRYDLIGRVFDLTRDTGFQEEKFSSLYLNIRWTKSELTQLIDKRINYLFQARYSKRSHLTVDQVFPSTVDGQAIVDYLVDRTLMRPRDIIDFVNTCIKVATQNDGYIDEGVVREAEVNYSKSRLDSLTFEWGADYPALKEWAKILKHSSPVFYVRDMQIDQVIKKGFEYCEHPDKTDIDSDDTLLNLCRELVAGNISHEDFMKKIIYILYRVGLLGVREANYAKVNWSYMPNASLQWDDIENDTELYVHPCFRSALKVQ